MSPLLEKTFQQIYVEIIEKFTLNHENIFEFEYRPWIFSVLGSIAIALMGVLPMLIIPVDTGGTDYSDRKYWFRIEGVLRVFWRKTFNSPVFLLAFFSGWIKILEDYLEFCCGLSTWWCISKFIAKSLELWSYE